MDCTSSIPDWPTLTPRPIYYLTRFHGVVLFVRFCRKGRLDFFSTPHFADHRLTYAMPDVRACTGNTFYLSSSIKDWSKQIGVSYSKRGTIEWTYGKTVEERRGFIDAKRELVTVHCEGRHVEALQLILQDRLIAAQTLRELRLVRKSSANVLSELKQAREDRKRAALTGVLLRAKRKSPRLMRESNAKRTKVAGADEEGLDSDDEMGEEDE